MVLKDKTQVTFHSGILTIGGTVIEVSYGTDHIFFDFGSEYRPELNIPNENIETLLENRLIPKLDNIYDSRFKLDEDKEQPYQNTAVFLSHAHLDHSKMINYLDPNIDLYALKETKSILNSLNRNGDFLLPSPFEESNFTREIIGLNPHDKIFVGQIEVEIAPVDHDAYGACALLIHTPDKFLVYSGDLRLHGFDKDLTYKFMEQAKGTDMLMMEGVSISFPERQKDPTAIEVKTEMELIDKFSRLIMQNPKRQITFNGYPANIKRFEMFVKMSPRTVVLEANMAALLKDTLNLNVPYYYKKEASKINSLDKELELRYTDLLKDDSNYIFQVDANQISDLKGGGLYIHSDAQPLGDFDPYYKVFLSNLHQQNIEFVRLALSGHAFPEDLNQIIASIKPKLLVPIHTLKPEKLENPYGDRILVERGQTITL